MRISVLQIDVDSSEPVADRVDRVIELTLQQRGSDLVLLPELWVPGAFAYSQWSDTAEPLDGSLVARFGEVARALGTHVHMGSIVERDGDALHNTSVVLGPDGTIQATYRKIHLFGFSEGEPALMSAGKEPVVWESPWGAVGLATCYDLRFPELFRALLDRGATMVLLTSGWPARRIGHWSLLARARAVENQVILVGCNEVGKQGRVTLGGRSLVVDPWGEVLAEAGVDAEVLNVDIDPTQPADARSRFPVLRDRVL